MANRILLNENSLKISQSGVNVLTATDAQLLFSSDWNAMGILQEGIFEVNSSRWAISGDDGWFTSSISLNKSFSSPPLCAFYLLQNPHLVPIGFGSGAFYGWVRSGVDEDNVCMIHMQTALTTIQVRGFYTKQYTPSLAIPSFSIRYVVFDYNT